jgi:uncharacterized membrane protein
MQETNENKQRIDLFFKISLAIKAVSAFIEVAAGFAAIFITQHFILRTLALFTQDELIEDPKDGFANYVLHSVHHFTSGGKLFIVSYLLSHGLVKLLLVIGLYMKKLWAYPLSLAVLGLFIVYQVHRYSITHSIFLIVLTVFDVFVMWLIWKEYKFMTLKRV